MIEVSLPASSNEKLYQAIIENKYNQQSVIEFLDNKYQELCEEFEADFAVGDKEVSAETWQVIIQKVETQFVNEVCVADENGYTLYDYFLILK